MAGVRFDQERLVHRLSNLDNWRQVSFALACALRLLPAYSNFHRETGQGDPGTLESATVRLRQDLEGVFLDPPELDTLVDACQRLVVGEEDPWTNWSGFAQNAAAAGTYALQCRRTGEAQEAAWAALQAYEAVDLLVTSRANINLNSPGVEDRIAEDPLVQAELMRQEVDLASLEELGSVRDLGVLAKLLDRSYNALLLGA